MTSIATLIACVALPVSLAADPALSSNAADVYRQVMKQLESLPREWTRWQDENWETPGVPLTENQERLVSLTHAHFELLMKAEGVRECRFNFERFNPVSYRFPPESMAVRNLGRLAALRMRHHLAAGKPQKGIDELGAVLVFSRRFGADEGQITLGVLVQTSIDALAADAFARHLPRMTPEARKALAARLASLPAGGSILAAAKVERQQMIGWFEREYPKDARKHTDDLIKGAEMSSSIRKAIFKSEKDEKFDPSHLRKLEALATGDREGYAKVLREAGDYWDKRIAVLALPPARVEKAWDELVAKPAPDNPLIPDIVSMVTGALINARNSELATQTQMRMLLAGIAYLDGGDAGSRRVTELHADEPFERVETAGGFELRSRRYKFGEESVKLHFGIRQDK